MVVDTGRIDCEEMKLVDSTTNHALVSSVFWQHRLSISGTQQLLSWQTGES